MAKQLRDAHQEATARSYRNETLATLSTEERATLSELTSNFDSRRAAFVERLRSLQGVHFKGK